MKTGRPLLFGLSSLFVTAFASPSTPFTPCAVAAPEPADQARSIYRRLSGRPLTSRDARYNQFVEWVRTGRKRDVAVAATEDPGFAGSIVRQWGSLLLTVQKNPNLQLNDTLATLIGSVRDNLDARTLLTANHIYGADPRLGLPRPNSSSTTVYEMLEQSGRDLKAVLRQMTPQWNSTLLPQTSGVLTTRWWGEQYYSAGTNRRAVVGALETFLCKPIENWKTPYLPTDRIRRDIDRAPSGDARIFQNECRSCHGAMDGLAGAFAHFNYDAGLLFTTRVQEKYLQNPEIYPEGYVTNDDSWVNFLTTGQNASFGWRGELEGRGIQAFGQMLANSGAFSACMAKRALQAVCNSQRALQDPVVQQLATEFENQDQYRLKDLFIRAALSTDCQTTTQTGLMANDQEGP